MDTSDRTTITNTTTITITATITITVTVTITVFTTAPSLRKSAAPVDVPPASAPCPAALFRRPARVLSPAH